MQKAAKWVPDGSLAFLPTACPTPAPVRLLFGKEKKKKLSLMSVGSFFHCQMPTMWGGATWFVSMGNKGLISQMHSPIPDHIRYLSEKWRTYAPIIWRAYCPIWSSVLYGERMVGMEWPQFHKSHSKPHCVVLCCIVNCRKNATNAGILKGPVCLLPGARRSRVSRFIHGCLKIHIGCKVLSVLIHR